jgi:cytochrome c553
MMNKYVRLIPIFFVLATFFILTAVLQAIAAGPMVSQPGNKHNLSALNSGAGIVYKATNDPINNPRGLQICIFCHTPHNANVVGQAPLWSRKFSSESFQRYSTVPNTLQIRKISDAQYGTGAQPNGSSMLCLSCHDGVSKLGDLYDGSKIAMSGADVISGITSFKPSTNKMKSGHHPVSFVYTAAIAASINSGKLVTTYQMPLLTQVKLDKLGRMQCTTCHDAHQNMSNDTDCYGGTCNGTNTRKMAPFWVYGVNNNGDTDQQAVCTTCHPMNAEAGFARPWPTP